MATLTRRFKKPIIIILSVLLLTVIIILSVSIRNHFLNYNPPKTKRQIEQLVKACLLYTSDAADEL